MRRRIRWVVAVFGMVSGGWAQQAGVPTSDLTDLPVEELLNLQVTSVGRKAQQLAKAPAAVFVITQEDLRRSGYITLADALRMVPGLTVGRIDGTNWAVSARGFQRAFSDKLLVLVDGRSVYMNMFSGVFWDVQDLLLEDVDRIEV
ncbi:MAG: Plug domain-containing protein, partial [Bryobacterales bacterium]|nr:Plug domain-containing protein [Bryobacterales bacterium]